MWQNINNAFPCFYFHTTLTQYIQKKRLHRLCLIRIGINSAVFFMHQHAKFFKKLHGPFLIKCLQGSFCKILPCSPIGKQRFSGCISQVAFSVSGCQKLFPRFFLCLQNGHFCIRPFCMKSTHKSCCPSACDYNSFHLFSPCHHIPFKEAVSPDRHHKVSEETSKCQVLHAAR